MAGAGLADGRLVCGLILDGHHVADAVAFIAFAAAAGRIALVTDAIAALGMPPGMYELGGEPVIVRDGEPPRRPDGTIAGACLRLDDAVARAVSLGVHPGDAIEAASRVPADVLGRDDLGRIAPGAPADLVWLGPDFRARATWIGGELAYGRPARCRRRGCARPSGSGAVVVEPRLARAVVVELDAVAVGVLEVDRDGGAVVGGVVDRVAVVEQPLDGAGELAPVGVDEGDVVEAGVAGRRRRRRRRSPRC